MNIHYRITIERIETVEQDCGKEWEVVEETPTGQNVYGYTPSIIKPVTVEAKVYEQIVDNMELSAVIRAVNSL